MWRFEIAWNRGLKLSAATAMPTGSTAIGPGAPSARGKSEQGGGGSAPRAAVSGK